MPRRRMVVLAALLSIGASTVIHAQWLNYPTPGTPRTKDGKPNLTAPAPRVNGKPDLFGVWQVQPTSLAEWRRLFGDRVDAFDTPGSAGVLLVLAGLGARVHAAISLSSVVERRRYCRCDHEPVGVRAGDPAGHDRTRDSSCRCGSSAAWRVARDDHGHHDPARDDG
jgi:hypothetical protein